MAIFTNCPACNKEYKLQDSFEGKRVRCKKCGDDFLVEADLEEIEEEIPEVELVEEEASRSGASARGRGGRRRSALHREERSRHDADAENDYKDYEWYEPERPQRKSSKLLVFGFLFLLLLTGGGVGAYFLYFDDPDPQQSVSTDDGGPPPEEKIPISDWEIPPATEGGAIFAGDDKVVPTDFRDATRVLRDRRANTKVTLQWLIEQPVDETSRGVVANALEVYLQQAGIEHRLLALEALSKWAMQNQLLFFNRIVETSPDEQEVALAMKGLGTIQDESTLPLLAEQLTNPVRRDAASKALLHWGPLAAEEVAKYIDHADPATKSEAIALRQKLRLLSDAAVTEALADIRSNVRDQQVQGWKTLAKIEPVEPRRGEIVEFVLREFPTLDFTQKSHAQGVLENWFSPDQVPLFINALKDPRFRSYEQYLMKPMVKSKDPRAVTSVVEALTNRTLATKASMALQEGGPETEEVLLQALTTTNDSFVRGRIASILEKIGGVKSIQLMQRLGTTDVRFRSTAERTIRIIALRLQRENM